MVTVQWLPINQAYAVMWCDQVLTVITDKVAAEDYAHWVRTGEEY